MGIPELWNCVAEYAAATKANGWFNLSRQNQAQQWMHEIIRRELKRRFELHPAIREQMKALEQEVAEGRSSSFRAARSLLEAYSDPSCQA